jgi:hypothetical protein
LISIGQIIASHLIMVRRTKRITLRHCYTLPEYFFWLH